MSKRFSRYELAKIEATIRANQQWFADDEDTVNAKFEIQRDVEGNDSNVMVEVMTTKKPSKWGILKAWLFPSRR